MANLILEPILLIFFKNNLKFSYFYLIFLKNSYKTTLSESMHQVSERIDIVKQILSDLGTVRAKVLKLCRFAISALVEARWRYSGGVSCRPFSLVSITL